MDPSSQPLDVPLDLGATLGNVPNSVNSLDPLSLLQQVQSFDQNHNASDPLSAALNANVNIDATGASFVFGPQPLSGIGVPLDPNDPNAHLLSTVNAGANDGLPGPASIPLSDFTRAREAILEEYVPRVQRLTKNVIVGLTHAYEPGMDPSRTANDLNDLREAFTALQRILHESGVGALPIDPSSLQNVALNTPASISTPLVSSTVKSSMSLSLSPSHSQRQTASPAKAEEAESPNKMALDPTPMNEDSLAAAGIQVAGQTLDDRVATRRVEEAFARVKRRKEAAEVALNILGWAS